MVWWWLAWAFAGVGEPATVAVALPLPEGVTRGPIARELTRPRPSAVTFVVEGGPTVRDGLLVVRGTLVNQGPRAATVHVATTPGTGGPFVLAPRGIPYRAAPDAEPPAPGTRSPEELVLPAGARVPFESGLRLERWAWPAGGGDVDLDWRFEFWTEPVTGTLQGRLQPRKP